VGRRYEEITKSRTRRLTWYLARRFLKLSVTEWEDLPWYEQGTYLEGFKEEGLYQEEETEQEEDLTQDWDALSRYGINVQNV
jgi:hypothetical protein